jgi:hypothetical protein
MVVHECVLEVMYERVKCGFLVQRLVECVDGGGYGVDGGGWLACGMGDQLKEVGDGAGGVVADGWEGDIPFPAEVVKVN